MESISYNKLLIVDDTLKQIYQTIQDLIQWNAPFRSANELQTSAEGMKTLAADCMLIEAIGEGIKKINKHTNGMLFAARPDIPWKLIMGMRNHIAHGYFDINADLVYDVITNDLPPLSDAIKDLQENLFNIISPEE